MPEAWFERVKWSYVWDTFGGFPLVMSLLVAAVITLSGLFGESSLWYFLKKKLEDINFWWGHCFFFESW